MTVGSRALAPLTKRGALFGFALLAIAFANVPSLAAEGTDPAIQKIEAFHATLISVAKRGPKLGMEGRYKELEPEVVSTFDMPVMTKFTVGPSWSKMQEPEHTALIAAFQRMTVATYANNFAKFEGQKFVVDPKVEVRNADYLVQSQVVPAREKPVSLTYRMRNADGAWKIIDVMFEHISQLATRRADFSTTLASGGSAALVKRLNEIADKLMQGK